MTDPFSVAVGGIGVASLALQLLGGCIEGFVLLSTAQNIGKDASTIVCMLDLQEASLTSWARSAGLLVNNGTLDRRLNSRLVETTLEQLQKLLLDTDGLKKKYGLGLAEQQSAAADKDTVTKAQEPGLSEMERVFTGISDETRLQILRRAKAAQDKNLFKRLRWAVVDKEKIEKLVADVHFLVRELWSLLEPIRHADLAISVEGIGSGVLKLNERFDQLTTLSEALTATLGALPAAQGDSLKLLAAVTDLKALRVGLEADSNMTEAQQQHVPSRQQLLKGINRLSRLGLAKFVPMKRQDTMGIAEYEGSKVFVEWKTLNPAFRSKILPRVENIAALLSLPKGGTFRSLTCKGISEQDGKIAFVFEHPCPENPAQPRSLVDLFSAKEGVDPPSLSVRVQLALQIARAVQSMHQAGWLHKNLRSENILFFGSEHGDAIVSSPLLAGFAFARLDSPTEISEQPSSNPKHDIYRHPDAMGEPSTSFSAPMDVYSLGTVLLEIAEWRPLRYLVDVGVDVSAESVPLTKLASIRPQLLSSQGKGGTSKLRIRAGDIYADTCMLCLRGEGNGASPQGRASEEPHGIDVVVQKLESCRI